ncbi:MAG: molybdopterin-dependent oxidoreductase [Burkholderiaceae bacterium]|nr:molybdopterin-dependent oxidoreductase [Burkholderiaceae bacterium]MDH3459671.1 molybdopterin-dependent oxidoreductase [Burkholderiaceae bacterium]
MKPVCSGLRALGFSLVVTGFLALPTTVRSEVPNVSAPPAAEVARSLAGAKAQETVLSVSTSQGAKSLTLAELEALGMQRITTRTFWPEDQGTYEGPRLADVLKSVGIAEVAQVRVFGLDGYSQVLPREDWTRWPLILATRKNGKPLDLRDKGPLRVIYPRDSDKTLQDDLYRLRWVWMVRQIEPVSR